MAKILRNIRVIEMGTYITGPAAAMQLADLGADVIKVERPGEGDPFRAFKGGLYSPHYQTYNRNKRSIALDTRAPADREIFNALIAGADVFIQNFRPGVAEKMGAGEAELRALNPRLIYCAISGMGRDGPARDRPVFDTVAQAASGFLRLVTPPTNSRVIGPAIADAVTGHYAATGILAALVERGSTGQGRRLDISMLEAMCHFNLDSFTHCFSVGEIMGPLSRPVVSQSYTFECSDGKWIAFHLSSPVKFWEGLLHATGQEWLADDPRFKERLARIEHQDDLIAILTRVFKAASRETWCARLEQAEVPYSPAYDSNEALEDPQAKHLGIAVTTNHPAMGPFTTVRAPYAFDGEVDVGLRAPPTLDEHGAEIRAEIARAGNAKREGMDMSGPTSVPVADVLQASKGMLQKQLYCIFTTAADGLGPIFSIIQEHLAYQVELEKEGILFAAGPLWADNGTEWEGEGLIVVRAGSLEAANAIAEQDPMHRSGARGFRVRPWLINEGSQTIRLDFSTQTFTIT